MNAETKAEADRLIITDLRRQAKQWRAFTRPADEDPVTTELRVLFYASEVSRLVRFSHLCERMSVSEAWRVAHGEG